MQHIKKISSFILVITGLLVSTQLYGNELLETYCTQLKQQAMLPYNNDQKHIVPMLVHTAAALKNIDMYFKAVNTNQQPLCSLSLLNNDLCSVFDTFNQQAPIKPASVFGTIKLAELLNRPIQATTDPKFLENQALIKFFKDFPELRTDVHSALSDLGRKAINVFIRDDTFLQWIELEHDQVSTFYKSISNLGYVTDFISGALYTEHFGARVINWGTSWLPSMLNTALPVVDPWIPMLWCAGGLLKIFSNGTRIQQAALEMKAKPIKAVIDPFLQSLSNISTALQAAFRLSGNRSLISLADEIRLPETTATEESVATIIEILDIIGTIDACQALATAEVNHTIRPVTISTSNNIEQGLSALWNINSDQTARPWIRNNNGLRMAVNNTQPNAQIESKKFLVNLTLSQAIGFVISNSESPITMPLIDISKVEVSTQARYADSKKTEAITHIFIKP